MNRRLKKQFRELQRCRDVLNYVLFPTGFYKASFHQLCVKWQSWDGFQKHTGVPWPHRETGLCSAGGSQVPQAAQDRPSLTDLTCWRIRALHFLHPYSGAAFIAKRWASRGALKTASETEKWLCGFVSVRLNVCPTDDKIFFLHSAKMEILPVCIDNIFWNILWKQETKTFHVKNHHHYSKHRERNFTQTSLQSSQSSIFLPNYSWTTTARITELNRSVSKLTQQPAVLPRAEQAWPHCRNTQRGNLTSSQPAGHIHTSSAKPSAD